MTAPAMTPATTKVLMTGAGGFCGKHLATYLKSQGVTVYTMGMHPPEPSDETVQQHFTIADITHSQELASIFDRVQPDYCFHLAGVASAADPVTFYRVNVSYAAALLHALDLSGLAANCPTLLVGTSAEYGVITPEQVPIHENTPVSPYHHYGISKLAQTHLGMAAARMGRPLVMVRPFNIIGPGMPRHLSVQSFATQVVKIGLGQQPPVIEVGNLGSSRDFIDVESTVRIYWQLLQNPQAYGEVINICSGQGVVMADLLQRLIQLSGVAVEVKVDPDRFKTLDIPVHYGCTQKLERFIHGVPHLDLDGTLQRVLDYLTVNPCFAL
ncbi:NAD-dependent epimerase/dehydratase family protein [Alkalinema sp. FACHB-956]|uniref:NAD-dependent epimerase/dehydratase family protein n=1 Tax=Alkalinema sp. FACHB-956 TaxID=2692768 RepID=UPI0016878D53|nr:NAD-dependent epimerase/dehydratase family protein [Alkalinema sp. FACHB-956]MBD2327817.1 NAD-dependent epimerase/dehydratase family protein [Alkalinema sp. FACHB-956]